MEEKEIEHVLEEVFFNALNLDGHNYPIQITLKSGRKFEGFKILENQSSYITGLSQEQRKDSVSEEEFFHITLIRKNSISTAFCPFL